MAGIVKIRWKPPLFYQFSQKRIYPFWGVKVFFKTKNKIEQCLQCSSEHKVL